MADVLLSRGALIVRRAASDEDIWAAQRLRGRVFLGRDAPDRDSFDADANHVLIEDAGSLVGTFRYHLFDTARAAASGYTAERYDLGPLATIEGRVIELGRFCLAQDTAHPDHLRAAWGALTRVVDQSGARLLIGCTSFAGTDPGAYDDAFALLSKQHVGPERLRPGRKSQEIAQFPSRDPDMTCAQASLPPLLRTYLLMGGWVSDHAVIDREMNTLHVFTAVDVHAVPPARARLLRQLAGD